MSKLLRRLTAKRTFIDDVLAGRALPADIDDYIASWHEAQGDSRVGSMQLHTFLGFSWDEYCLWGEHPESLRFIIAARKRKQSVGEIIKSQASAAAAARSNEQSDAERTLAWLRERGRI